MGVLAGVNHLQDGDDGRSLRAELLIADVLLPPQSADRKFLPSAFGSEEAVKAAYARIT